MMVRAGLGPVVLAVSDDGRVAADVVGAGVFSMDVMAMVRSGAAGRCHSSFESPARYLAALSGVKSPRREVILMSSAFSVLPFWRTLHVEPLRSSVRPPAGAAGPLTEMWRMESAGSLSIVLSRNEIKGGTTLSASAVWTRNTVGSPCR